MNLTSIRSVIGKRIKKLRMEKSLTQKDLAKAAGLHWTHVSKIESSKRIPTVKAIAGLAEALGIEAWELLIEEIQGRPGQKKKEQLIEIIRRAGPEQIEIYTKLILALHKKND
ncbi:MAG: helix-turn-helix domain-containing protein [Candidatus Omnitrophica bacterium]|nr:helix-turn-helix domain-containing protein [Candidatus Omnitrophota bacterium]MBU4492281.1 helix-turn-helix domain-containing protein [Euryarchaeota archaeon]